MWLPGNELGSSWWTAGRCYLLSHLAGPENLLLCGMTKEGILGKGELAGRLETFFSLFSYPI